MTNKPISPIHIVGWKNSGKTTLILELIETLTGRGLRVGCIKHTSHKHELDVPGKDSHRVREAGAGPVSVISGGLIATYKTVTTDSGNPYDYLGPLYQDSDLVIVEGDHETSHPKLEVWRAVSEREPMAKSDENIKAVITDDEIDVSASVLSRADIGAICDRMLEIVEAEVKEKVS